MTKLPPTMTDRVYGWIVEYIDAVGYSPSVRDLQELCRVSSTSVVSYHLNKLQAAGRIVRDPAVARSIRVVGA